MGGEPIVREHTIRELRCLLPVGNHLDPRLLNLSSERVEFLYGLFGAFLLIHLDFGHEFIVQEGLLIEEEVSWLDHQDAGGICWEL
jgi:hypothetical protein